MSQVLVVYCSMTGNTKAAAEAVAEGARAAGAQVVLKDGVKADAKALLACDAVALGSYDAFSYMGGGLKDFLDSHAGVPISSRQQSGISTGSMNWSGTTMTVLVL